ncbi:unnamed protein product, partial [Musa textilis]
YKVSLLYLISSVKANIGFYLILMDIISKHEAIISPLMHFYFSICGILSCHLCSVYRSIEIF